ncbi:MAG TPA: heparan-alpha-glucosaminide N-acetyltransferase domain-containing protein [Terriglobales bacterium]|nr:heparan-alpha-glucosaminide N-acetyltransferase domain-containing protein [Terriglobales bacterium]
MNQARGSRLAYVDWMRGLACVLMFQTHCYDAWLSPAAKKSTFFMWSQLLGTLPAPLFLFLAGISVALVTGKLHEAGRTPSQIIGTTIRRGGEILGLGLLFRLQEYLIAFPWAPWSDLFRVDILNTIGVSIILMGVVLWGTRKLFLSPENPYSKRSGVWVLGSVAAVTAAAISLATPLLWTTWRPRWLPWPLESYIDGVHNLSAPQAWLFPIFPWTAFAFAGLACGLVLRSPGARKRETLSFVAAGVAGIPMIIGGRWLDTRPQLYPVSDFWHTSPNFFLIRVGLLLMILLLVYGWCRWGLGGRGFSPLVQLGHTSLLVYWVHIEFVYGRLSILKKHVMSITGASAGLLIIFLAMLVLSLIRTHLKGRRGLPSSVHSPVRAQTQQVGP